jgi:hypothetical protein
MRELIKEISRNMRDLELAIKNEKGTESAQYYRFLLTDREMEGLIDSIPKLREEILKDKYNVLQK